MPGRSILGTYLIKRYLLGQSTFGALELTETFCNTKNFQDASKYHLFFKSEYLCTILD